MFRMLGKKVELYRYTVAYTENEEVTEGEVTQTKEEFIKSAAMVHRESSLTLVVEKPVQFCPLCRSVAVLVLDGDTVDGESSAILEPGFHPVGVHVVAAGKQFVHKKTSMFFTFTSSAVESFSCPFANI